MAQFEKKPFSLVDRPLKRLWHEVYHIGSFAAGFMGVFFLYSKLAPFPSAHATPFGQEHIAPWIEHAVSHERAHKDYGVMVIKYLQNPEVIIANQHRSRYIPFSERHLLNHNIEKRPAEKHAAGAETAPHTMH